YRVRRALAALAGTLPERRVALCRELTKVHEEVLRGTAAEVLAGLGEPVKGEITLVISHEPS
ncbi:MAG TPA: 16S rRNA (cytidine(1402)-2'-O)-methyltransferase, partial [Terriglobales bacterium]|nr:16S rRNA (cytidine(1402)-2'-O)-methyltransferase [Terriglobales bacterium]